jgi:hypothetical protein
MVTDVCAAVVANAFEGPSAPLKEAFDSYFGCRLCSVETQPSEITWLGSRRSSILDLFNILQSREAIERLKFDDHGNWTEQKMSTWVAGVSKTESTEVEPTELHHRTITYY